MDPLSITASIIAVIQLASDVVATATGPPGHRESECAFASKCLSAIRFPQQLKDEADDIKEGKAWSETVQTLEARQTDHWDGCGLRWMLSKLKPKKRLREALSNSKWPFDEKDVEKIISTAEREKTVGIGFDERLQPKALFAYVPCLMLQMLHPQQVCESIFFSVAGLAVQQAGSRPWRRGRVRMRVRGTLKS
jgi:hypothetical protein